MRLEDLEDVVETAVRRSEVFTAARREIDELTVTHRSPDGAVSVTVGSSGALIDVTCSDRVATMPAHQLAATFRACVQAAQAGVAGRVEEILRRAAPGDPLTEDLVAQAHQAFPPPVTPEPTGFDASTVDGGPRHMAIGDIEDRDPRPRRRPVVARRPRSEPDDPDDWGARTFLT